MEPILFSASTNINRPSWSKIKDTTGLAKLNHHGNHGIGTALDVRHLLKPIWRKRFVGKGFNGRCSFRYRQILALTVCHVIESWRPKNRVPSAAETLSIEWASFWSRSCGELLEERWTEWRRSSRRLGQKPNLQKKTGSTNPMMAIERHNRRILFVPPGLKMAG